MNNKFNNSIRVSTELEVSKECSSFHLSPTDRFNKVVITTDPPPMPNTPTFVANLPSWQQSLLDILTTEHSHQEILEMLQTSMKPPIIATDGSVKPYRAQGTFAWVLAHPDGTP
jgi:hypothetical protein